MIKLISEYEYENVRLSLIEHEDIEELRLLRNANRKFFLNSSIITKEQQEMWYNNYKTKNSDYMFKVTTLSNPKKIVGMVALYDIRHDLKQCEFGRIIIDHEKIQMPNAGTKVTMAACEIAFTQLGMQRVVLEVLADNIRAYKAYLKAGFVEIPHNEKMELSKNILYMERLRNK